jgi:hypothetical protein
MQTFKQFLSEAIVKSWSSYNVLTDDAINLLNTHCKDGLKAIANNGLLYRGDKSFSGDFVSLDLSDMVRTSRDSNNLYQLMMDNSTSLSSFPKRSNSLICSTSVTGARNYSTNVYAIIPYDNTMIVVGEQDDFPETKYASGMFKNISLNDFGYALGGPGTCFLSVLRIDRNAGNQYTDLAKIDSALSKATPEEIYLAMHAGYNLADKAGCALSRDDFPKSYRDTFEMFLGKPSLLVMTSLANYIKTAKLTVQQNRLLNYLKALPKNERFSTIMNDSMTPENLELSLVRYGSKLPTQAEVWFSGKAIAIKLDIFNDIQKQLGN